MDDQRVVLIVKIKAKEGLEYKVKAELLGMIEPTQAEAGCVKYDLHQAKDDSGVFYFYEIWASGEALDSHMQTPHLKSLLAKADDLFAEPIDGVFVDIIS